MISPKARKGMGILGGIMAVVVIIILLGMITNTYGNYKTALNPEKLKEKNIACKAEVENAIRKGIQYIDLDKDECLDTFDNCLDAPNQPNTDTDLDGRPDRCDLYNDKAKDDPTETRCAKGLKIENDEFRCCTQEYKTEVKEQPGKWKCS